MKKIILALTVALFAVVGVAQSYTKSFDVERKKQQDRERMVKDAMRRGVMVMPLRTYPDDYINPGSTTDRSLPEELQATSWDKRLNCVKLKPEQIVISKSYTRTRSVTAMENKDNETLITFSIPVSFDKQWHACNKYEVMVDSQTGDRYFPRRVLHNIPFDKVLIIEGCRGATINFTIVYAQLRNDAEKIVFTEDRPIQTELPLNRAPKSDIMVDNVQDMLKNSVKKGRDIF